MSHNRQRGRFAGPSPKEPGYWPSSAGLKIDVQPSAGLAIAAGGRQTPGTMAMTLETVFRTCGAECEYAEEIRGTFGEWFWCKNPGASVRVVRAMHECALPRPTARMFSPPPVPPPAASDEARRVA